MLVLDGDTNGEDDLDGQLEVIVERDSDIGSTKKTALGEEIVYHGQTGIQLTVV